MYVRVRTAMTAVVLAACAAGATAQISLSSAVDLAWRGDARIKSAQADVDKARAAVASSHDAYIPIIAATAGVGESKGVPLSVPVIFSLSANSLVFNFSQRDNVRAAEAGLQAANLKLKDARDQVAEDVVVTYLQLANAQQRQTTMAEELAQANRLVVIVQERLDAGEDTRIELLRARRTAKQIELQQLQVGDEVNTLGDHLERLIGLPGNHLLAVASSIPGLPAIQTVQDRARQPEPADSYGIQAAFANAHSKQEIAFGEARYRFRPQISLGASYDRISTDFTDYSNYYPGFTAQSQNAYSVGIQIQIPLLDRRHDATAREDAADAAQAYYEAVGQRDLFREGRLKLQRSAMELQTQAELAALDRDLAQEDLNTLLLQLSASSADAEKPQMTPKDEQNARLAASARTVDLLNAQFQLTQLQVNLMRQTGQLDTWLKTAVGLPETTVVPATTP